MPQSKCMLNDFRSPERPWQSCKQNRFTGEERWCERLSWIWQFGLSLSVHNTKTSLGEDPLRIFFLFPFTPFFTTLVSESYQFRHFRLPFRAAFHNIGPSPNVYFWTPYFVWPTEQLHSSRKKPWHEKILMAIHTTLFCLFMYSDLWFSAHFNHKHHRAESLSVCVCVDKSLASSAVRPWKTDDGPNLVNIYTCTYTAVGTHCGGRGWGRVASTIDKSICVVAC